MNTLFMKMFLLSLLISQSVIAQTDNHLIEIKDLVTAKEWLNSQGPISYEKLLNNINPSGTVPGVVVASPQTENPNYFRHWIRDSALVMDVVLQKFQQVQNHQERKFLKNLILKYMAFSIENQNRASLGEPIFEVSGFPFLGPWGRPQNDGPALRSIVFSKWALMLIKDGQIDFVKKYLYSGEWPAKTLIKRDLEYVSTEWMNPCFDLWEEVKAKHFYTQMVQRRALVLGSQLAIEMKDFGAADWYQRQVYQIDHALKRFLPNGFVSTGLNDSRNYILTSVDWTEGMTSKVSQLDISVILAVLHGESDRSIGVLDQNVLSTFYKLVETFSELYPINRSYSEMAPAIGRYPEDIYGGSNFNGGNPWVLTTLAMAEYSYKVASAKLKKNSSLVSITQAQKWIAKGDEFVLRVQLHANPDGSLSEQIDRYSGYMSSARDLTWNYAALLTASWARESALDKLNKFK